MDAQHAPAPWDLASLTTKAARNKLALRGGGRRICDISVYDERDWANVRLMKAAPDLLAALEHVTGLLAGGFPPNDIATVSALHEARAAIAKARGS